MSRITAERIQRLKTFMDSLPDEARSKCSLCTTTLTHIVKQAEAETGVGTATVARALAEKINETALPADRVSGEQLRDRVRYQAGEKVSGKNPQIKKLTKAEKIEAVDNLVAEGMADLEAVGQVAKGTGRAGRDNLLRQYLKHCSRRQEEELRVVSAQSKPGRPSTKEAFDGVTAPLNKQGESSRALLTAEMAIGVLESISDDDPDRYEAFSLVRTWMDTEEAVCRK
ncbi:MAG: hypothetical protein EOM37_12530 [Proteobacteria bacterium]|nr:hypothetical protein [Pseudomonadota bacterium]